MNAQINEPVKCCVCGKDFIQDDKYSRSWCPPCDWEMREESGENNEPDYSGSDDYESQQDEDKLYMDTMEQQYEDQIKENENGKK